MRECVLDTELVYNQVAPPSSVYCQSPNVVSTFVSTILCGLPKLKSTIADVGNTDAKSDVTNVPALVVIS